MRLAGTTSPLAGSRPMTPPTTRFRWWGKGGLLRRSADTTRTSISAQPHPRPLPLSHSV